MLNGKNISSFCGPFAIAAITGISIVDIIDAFKKLRINNGNEKRAKRIKGVYNGEMREILSQFNFNMNRIDGLKEISLKRFVETEGKKHLNVPILVNVTGHYVVLFNGIMTDTTYRIPVAFQFVKRYRRSSVLNAWTVTPKGH
jgi:hypothetical protein